jgi:hypothetical protein
MFSSPNPKVIGAFVVGFALIAGAYLVSDFKAPGPIQTASVIDIKAPPRVAIAVTDKDKNGIEDWRDEFVSSDQVRLEVSTSSEYTMPTTLTGQLGINLFESFIRARSAGSFGNSKEEVVSDAVGVLRTETAVDLYDTKHVSVMRTWDQNDIKNYANSMAGAITRNDVKGLESELFILDDIVNRNNDERIGELETIAAAYKRIRDDSLTIPVPELFLKQHLDLINTYNALYKDIDAMSLTFEDPVVSLLHLKRYQDDVLGMELALENMYVSIEPYTGLFSANDPALLFAAFSPDNQNPQ